MQDTKQLKQVFKYKCSFKFIIKKYIYNNNS